MEPVIIDSERVEKQLAWLILEGNLVKFGFFEAAEGTLNGAPNYKQVLENVIKARPKHVTEAQVAAIFGFTLGLLTAGCRPTALASSSDAV